MFSPVVALGNACPSCSRGCMKSLPARLVVNVSAGSCRGGIRSVSVPGVERQLGISRGECERSMKPSRGSLQVHRAVFGVGAPEAILVGVVALVVFGPKGLAEAAKSLGKAVRSFQPTLKELAEVSTDLKSTLEQEIGLDEIKSDINSIRNPLPSSTNVPTTPRPQPADVVTAGGNVGGQAGGVKPGDAATAVAEDPDIERKRAASLNAAWGGDVPQTLDSPTGSAKSGESRVVESGESRVAESGVTSGKKSLADMSTAELEEELKRRSKA